MKKEEKNIDRLQTNGDGNINLIKSTQNDSNKA